MITPELTQWIRSQNRKIDAKFGQNDDTETEAIYARALKLNEEVGELCAEVLATRNHQRPDKLAQQNTETLGHEIADVLLCTLILADSLGVDIDKSLQEKIAKVDERFKDISL